MEIFSILDDTNPLSRQDEALAFAEKHGLACIEACTESRSFIFCHAVADSAWSLGHSRKRVRLMCSFWQMSSMSRKLATVQTRLTTVSLTR